MTTPTKASAQKRAADQRIEVLESQEQHLHATKKRAPGKKAKVPRLDLAVFKGTLFAEIAVSKPRAELPQPVTIIRMHAVDSKFVATPDITDSVDIKAPRVVKAFKDYGAFVDWIRQNRLVSFLYEHHITNPTKMFHVVLCTANTAQVARAAKHYYESKITHGGLIDVLGTVWKIADARKVKQSTWQYWKSE